MLTQQLDCAQEALQDSCVAQTTLATIFTSAIGLEAKEKKCS